MKPRVIPQAIPLRLNPQRPGGRPTDLPDKSFQHGQSLIRLAHLRINRGQICRDERSVKGVGGDRKHLRGTFARRDRLLRPAEHGLDQTPHDKDFGVVRRVYRFRQHHLLRDRESTRSLFLLARVHER